MDKHRDATESLDIRTELAAVKAALQANDTLLAKAQEELDAWRTHSERALEAERERARRDALTGVLNHAAIVDVLGAHLAD